MRVDSRTIRIVNGRAGHVPLADSHVGIPGRSAADLTRPLFDAHKFAQLFGASRLAQLLAKAEPEANQI